MKNFDLNAMGVIEMNGQEMLNVEGGNVFVAVAKAVAGFATGVADAVAGVAVMVWDALNNPQPQLK